MHAHAAVIDFNYVIFYVLYTTTLITVNISRGGGGEGGEVLWKFLGGEYT
jgi:hypothetical protein